MGAAACAATIAAKATTFTYDELTDDDRQWLRGAATQLRATLRRTVAEVVAGGRLLAAARLRLGRDRWKPWLMREAQIPLRSAARLVNVGKAFGTLSESAVLNFTPTALYTLSEPGVPQSVREYAVGQARDGEEVTAALVTSWLAALRECPPDLKPRALAELAPEDEELEPNPVDPADVSARENWFVLRDMVGTDGSVHLSGLPDAENGTVSYAGTRIGADGKAVRAFGETVEAVVLQLAGAVRTKVCARCEEDKPLDAYCRRGDLPDGREYRCKACERERVKGWAKRKAAEAVA